MIGVTLRLVLSKAQSVRHTEILAIAIFNLSGGVLKEVDVEALLTPSIRIVTSTVL